MVIAFDSKVRISGTVATMLSVGGLLVFAATSVTSSMLGALTPEGYAYSPR